MMESSWIHIGLHGNYHWLEVEGDVRIGQLIDAFPELVYQRYLAITSHRGRVVQLTGDETTAGWQLRDGIAYSPQVLERSLLPSSHSENGPAADNQGAGGDEWYCFSAPRDLGKRHAGDPFLEAPSEGRPYVFANFAAFRLNTDDAELDFMREWFWQQMEWSQPDAYIGDGMQCTFVVTRDADLVERVCDYLYDIIS